MSLDMTVREMVLNHTREMVSSGMAYALAKLSEDPGWLRRMDRGGSLGDALVPDVDDFMLYRGESEADWLLKDLAANW